MKCIVKNYQKDLNISFAKKEYFPIVLEWSMIFYFTGLTWITLFDAILFLVLIELSKYTNAELNTPEDNLPIIISLFAMFVQVSKLDMVLPLKENPIKSPKDPPTAVTNPMKS